MQKFEYLVKPAPRRGEKARGVKTSEDRFALALTQVLNETAAQGWEYLRTDSLPLDERAGLTGGTKTSTQNMLVFRRELPNRAEQSGAARLGGATEVKISDTSGAPVVGPARG